MSWPSRRAEPWGDEVLVGPARSGRLQVARGALADLGPDLELPDCRVLYAAELAPATAIATFDGRLAAAARVAGIGVAS